MPVQLTSASFTPWSGLRLTGISVPQSDAAADGNFFEAAAFTARLRLAPILRRRLEITQVGLETPKVTWRQTAQGEWRLPQRAPPPESAPAPSTAAVETPASATPSAQAEQPPAQTGGFEVSVSRLKISDGTFDFLDNHSKRLASLSGVDVTCPVADKEKIEGKASSEKISIKDHVFLEKLRTPFSYAGGTLLLPAISTSVADGTMNGSFKMQTDSADSPFSTSVKVQNVNLDRLITEAGGTSGQVSGRFNGFLDVSGMLANAKSLSGSGQIVLMNGQIQQYEFLQMLGKGLQIEELMQLTLRNAQADYRIENGDILLDQLLLESPNLKLTAQGTVHLDGALDLRARLTIYPKISHQLPRIIAENFTPVENSDQRYVDFDVKGTISKPKTNLLERMVGRKIEKQAIDLIRSLFGKKPGKTDPTPAPPK
jgi:type II secretion system protein N